ncbi:5-formyltetrahydrofolate cyclo-ligase [Christiangramia fulva]|uniref:5-formyltetrahydrofolate cyclo-ligase n=1 Tax=Christiangramia fulva TaxID=2126553 RepID=A0A2R3Z410_9FLAO|nr:5-formyltetrahydrofolate cyclo-ligase [Christiangramia fulva]AVR44952.1 5-formyltetrahydrofolate cyclo-ligase [Christiangramia fulva]
MKKSELRKKYKELRLQLSDEEIEDKSIQIANKALELPIWNYKFYHLFLSITSQKEVNTEYLLQVLQGKDKNVVIPKTDFKTGKLFHYLLTDQTLIKTNRWNIPEPQEGIEISTEKLDVVFIPLLAFDQKGHRVGYGKGFYDRFLAGCRPDIVKIGVSFFGPVKEIKEVYASDIPLSYCVTPEKIYKFGH